MPARPEKYLKVIQTCRPKNIPVIFTQHGHTDPDSDGGILGEWWERLRRIDPEVKDFLITLPLERKT